MKLKKMIPVAAVLAGVAVGSVAGYLVREAQVSPALQSLSAALELVTGREAKAQAAYETSQAKLALAQEGILAKEEEHRKQLAALRNNRIRAELSLRSALVESKQKVAEAEAIPIPPHVVIPEGPETTKEDYLAELDTAAAWEHLAIIRQSAIEGLKKTQVQLLATNTALRAELNEEQAYRFTVEQERDLWKKRFTVADKRVNKMKGSRLKWMAGLIAGAAAGIYFSGR